MSPLVRVEDLALSFSDRPALAGVSFALHANSTTALLGANGCGKSTLLRCILGLQAPGRGSVRVMGLDPVRAARSVRGLVGYVPDTPDAYPWMTARELFRLLAVQVPGWSQVRAGELAERLRAPLDTRFESMSRGESAKGMLIAALAPAPPLALFDEPFARLAAPAREEVLRVLLEETPSEGGAALIATHDLELAARVADRVLVLDAGRLVADVEAQELQASRAGRSGLPAALRSLYPDALERLAC